jgi:SAM-dependent methyltransferase
MTSTELDHSLSTDTAWEEWGQRDPYFGVITNPRFRRRELTAEARQEFFRSGELHVDHVFDLIRRRIRPDFAPKRVLDFGCGVGRTLLRFAALAAEVIGVDVSSTMLLEARRNCEAHGARNVQLLMSDDSLSCLAGDFDLVYSCIVFQHIPVERGRAIFARLLRLLRRGGVGAVHLTYAKSYFPETYGVPPLPVVEPARNRSKRRRAPSPAEIPAQPGANGVLPDPEMQMNSYPLSEMLFSLQSSGVRRFHAEFTDHGGELGVFLFFQRPVDDHEPPAV